MRILMLDLDTLRPDHLGCYGYQRNTSPNIDRIAASALRFDQYYCTDAPCLPSRSALTTGRYGIHTGVVNHGGVCADMRPEGIDRSFGTQLNKFSLAGTMRRAGLTTTSISPFAERHSAWWFHSGYNETLDPAGKCGGESAEEVTPTVLDWVARNANKDDWFLHINFWDPHTPYRAPESFGNPFANEPLPAWMTQEIIEEHRTYASPHGAREVGMYDSNTNPKLPRQQGEIQDMEAFRRHIDGYDCGIAYMDEHIGQIVSAIENIIGKDELIVWITSDHGENQGELGLYGEHATADAITCRIPMIIKWPGKTDHGLCDTDLHLNIDLLPTLCDLLGLPPSPQWDGQSYAPALQGEACGREYAVISQCAHVLQRSVRFGDTLYMRTIHDGFHANFRKEMLFDIKSDPHEQHDLALIKPELCAKGARYMLDWLEEQMASSPSDIDPLWTVYQEGGPFHAKGHGAAYAKRLEETERVEQAAILRANHPREFV